MLSKVDEKIEKPLPQWETGRVKWFDRTRRFGFVYVDDSDDEVYLHWTVVQESNIREHTLKQGTRVRFVSEPIKGGRPRVVQIRLIQDQR